MCTAFSSIPVNTDLPPGIFYEGPLSIVRRVANEPSELHLRATPPLQSHMYFSTSFQLFPSCDSCSLGFQLRVISPIASHGSRPQY